ncbi:MAG: hypothetical protein RLZZ522_848, partial [Verrucomicrobiota bacterium]
SVAMLSTITGIASGLGSLICLIRSIIRYRRLSTPACRFLHLKFSA